MANPIRSGSIAAPNPDLAAAAPSKSQAARFAYEIRIRDHLETYWHRWFEGWQTANLEGGEVILTRANADQPALHGALIKIRDLNLTLLAVRRVDLPDPASVRR